MTKSKPGLHKAETAVISGPTPFITKKDNICCHCDDHIDTGSTAYHDGRLGPFCSTSCAGEWDVEMARDYNSWDKVRLDAYEP